MDLDENGATSESVIDQLQHEPVEKSMEDTMRETLRSISERDGQTDTEETKSPEVEKPKRVRAQDGKFSKEEKTSEISNNHEVPTEDVQNNTNNIGNDGETAPNTWKKEAKAAWDKLDPNIKAEVTRREADFHRGIEQYRGAAQYAQQMDNAIAPYRATMQKLGITPAGAVAELMSADHKLRYGSQYEKQTYFMQLAHNYGVDLGATAETQRTTDPNLYTLQMQNQQLQNQIATQQDQVRQQTEASLHSEISTFASDPKNIHFEAVRGHMSALLQAGQAQTLQDAYEQAIYANPTTRATVIQQQAQVAKEEMAKKAQVAKAAASVNVRSRPAIQPKDAVGSMEDTLRAIYRRSQGLT